MGLGLSREEFKTQTNIEWVAICEEGKRDIVDGLEWTDNSGDLLFFDYDPSGKGAELYWKARYR
jgi:hypothetical protein